MYEVIAIDDDLKELLRNGTTDAKSILQKKGLRSLAQSAYELLKSGRTSLEEVYPILSAN